MVQDHVHVLIKIPPKYAISEVIGYIKGKSAIAVARQFGGRQKNFNGERFGHEDMLFQQLDSRKRRSELTLKTRINWTV